MNKLTYMPPTLELLGTVSRLTMGNNGSSLDGLGTMTQFGPGNDDQEDGGPNSGMGGNGKGGGNGRPVDR